MQERIENTTNTTKAEAALYKAPEIDITLARSTNTMRKVRVVHGANEQYFDNLEGKTVGSIRKSLREVFNIPGDADALVDGKTVQDDFVLAGGHNLEFFKEAGIKGLICNC